MLNDVGRRFLFFINKIENNTIHISQLLQTNQTIPEGSFTNNNNYERIPCLNQSLTNSVTNSTIFPYDSSGAAKYIVVVVLVYGFGIIFFIGSQVRSTQKFSDEVDGVNAEKILRSMETEIFTKEVLEKLSNKEHREKAWKIYLSDQTTDPEANPDNPNLAKNIYDDERVKQTVDKAAVENIERKLKLLNKVQSSYKRRSSTAEIETVKEVLKTPKTRKFGDDLEIPICNNYSLKQKPGGSSCKFSKNQTKRDNKSQSANSMTPLLILQTDEEGLMKFKESKAKSKDKNKATSDLNSGSSIIADNYSDSNSDSKNINVSFDICEISEQITSV